MIYPFIQVQNGVENCPGTQKYLIVNYSCKPANAKGGWIDIGLLNLRIGFSRNGHTYTSLCLYHAQNYGV